MREILSPTIHTERRQACVESEKRFGFTISHDREGISDERNPFIKFTLSGNRSVSSLKKGSGLQFLVVKRDL